jgi:phosphoglycolate phosphatase
MSAPTPWRAVLLDLDGTLLDTLPDLAEAANAMRVSLGMPALDAPLISTFIGKGVDVLIVRALAGRREAPEPEAHTFAQARNIFHEHYHRVNGLKSIVYEGVREGLAALGAMNLKLGVVTNKPTEFTLPLLERTGLLDSMSVVVCGDTCEERKPHPAPILFACQKLQCEPRLVLTIGDSINDALAARAAGCTVLAVPYGYNEGEPVTELPVDAIVPTVLAAVDWLKNHSPKL